MANKMESWLSANPSSGSGNGTVQVSATENTGRNVRTSFISFSVENNSVSPVTRTVNQKGKPEFVTIDEESQVPKEGKTNITIKGQSNSQALTFSQGSVAIDLLLDLPDTYRVNGMDVENGEAIPGDPGATASYEFQISLSIPKNETTESKTAVLVVEDYSGNEDSCIITLNAGDAYITISSGDIELNYSGDPVSVQVQSNVNWVVS